MPMIHLLDPAWGNERNKADFQNLLALERARLSGSVDHKLREVHAVLKPYLSARPVYSSDFEIIFKRLGFFDQGLGKNLGDVLWEIARLSKVLFKFSVQDEWYSTGMEKSAQEIIVVQDFPNFVGGLMRFYEVCQRFRTYPNPYFFFLDATPNDLRDLNAYLLRRIQEFCKGPLFSTSKQLIYEQGGQSCTVSSSNSALNFEGHFQLDIQYREDASQRLADLMSVHYGMFSSTEAVIYALQAKQALGYSHASTQSQILSLGRTIAEWKPYVLKDVLHLDTDASMTEEDLYAQMDFYFCSEHEDEVEEFWMDECRIELAQLIRLRKRKLYFERNEAHIRVIRKKFNRGIPERAGRVRNAPIQGVLSLITTLAHMHAQGIRKIHIPKKMCGRLHHFKSTLDAEGEHWEWDPKGAALDERVLLQKELLCQRIAWEVEGVNFENPPDGDYFLLTLGEKLTPHRQVMQDFLGLFDGEPRVVNDLK